MLHDPNNYHEPMVFRPERFIPTEDHAPELDPRNIAFGFGRRYVGLANTLNLH